MTSDKKNSKFDLDLKYGQIQEKKVAKMLGDCKIEVKNKRVVFAICLSIIYVSKKIHHLNEF